MKVPSCPLVFEPNSPVLCKFLYTSEHVVKEDCPLQSRLQTTEKTPWQSYGKGTPSSTLYCLTFTCQVSDFTSVEFGESFNIGNGGGEGQADVDDKSYAKRMKLKFEKHFICTLRRPDRLLLLSDMDGFKLLETIALELDVPVISKSWPPVISHTTPQA